MGEIGGLVIKTGVIFGVRRAGVGVSVRTYGAGEHGEEIPGV